MRSSIKNIILMMLPLLASCNHKDLCYDSGNNLKVNVVFDWSNAPEGNPASMALYMYDAATGQSLRYIFDNRFGGSIRLPFGSYNALCMNSDNTDWARISNNGDIEGFEIYTADAAEMPTNGLYTAVMPRAEGTGQERVAKTPEMFWSSRSDGIEFPEYMTEKTITLYPEENICHYTVDILDVKNMEYLQTSTIDGTLSGMAEGYNMGRRSSTGNYVTMPFTVSESSADSLHGEFLTFGETPEAAKKHIMTIYMYLNDGTKWYYTFDVTDQVHLAPDPRNVHIVVRGFEFPQPITEGGSIIPNVNDWQSVHITMKM